MKQRITLVYIIICLLVGLSLSAQTATNLVFFPIRDFTGGTNITSFNITPDPILNPSTPDGLNVAGGPTMSFPLTNGTNTVPLFAGGYTVTAKGWVRGVHIVVNNTNTTVPFTYLATNGIPQPINGIYGFGFLPSWALINPLNYTITLSNINLIGSSTYNGAQI